MLIDYDTLDYNDKKTWDLICKGWTKGCFQIQSFLGRDWCKKIKPRSIEELSALVSLIRPGCLEVIIDGKSVPQHYADRKNGLSPTEYFHPALEPILKDTYGLLIYQEQSIKIAQQLAGFSPIEADSLRKGIGKKLPEVIAGLKKGFIEGCAKQGIVTPEEAGEIFGWIEKSQRYSFNKSHGVSYAINAYISAYCKANHTLSFFRSFLNYTPEEPKGFEKISTLVDDSKIFDIYIRTPDIRLGNIDFAEDPARNEVICGLKCIRNVGNSTIFKLQELLKSGQAANIGLVDWMFGIWPQLNSAAVINLISVGTFDFLKVDRKRLIFLYQNTAELTTKEREWITTNKHNYKSVLPLLLDAAKTKKEGGATHSVKRKEKVLGMIKNIQEPPFSLKDDIDWIIRTEKHLLGFSSASRISTVEDYQSTSSCLDILNRKVQNACISVEIREVRERTIKKGDNAGRLMASLAVEDETCVLDNVLIFADKYAKFQSMLEPDNCVRLVVYCPKDKDSVIINQVEQL